MHEMLTCGDVSGRNIALLIRLLDLITVFFFLLLFGSAPAGHIFLKKKKKNNCSVGSTSPLITSTSSHVVSLLGAEIL